MVWYYFRSIKNWISWIFWYARRICWPDYCPRYRAFTFFMLIPMIKIMTLQLEVVLTMQLPFRKITTILYHLDSFNHLNVTFKLKNVTAIQSIPHLAGYLLTSLNGNFLPAPSMTVWQRVPFSQIIYIKNSPAMNVHLCENLLQLILYIITRQPFIIFLHAFSYFLAQSHCFQIYMVWK